MSKNVRAPILARRAAAALSACLTGLLILASGALAGPHPTPQGGSAYPAGATRPTLHAEPCRAGPARSCPLAPPGALAAQEQATGPEGPRGQPGAGARRLPSDAAPLLHRGLRSLHGRTVLLPVAVLAGARGDDHACQRARRGQCDGPRTASPSRGPAVVSRHGQLRRSRRDLHEYPGRVRRDRRATGRSRRAEVLRRQRLGRDRARTAVQAHPQRLRPRPGRGHHGLRDGGLAEQPGTRLCGRHPVLERDRQHRPQHGHDGTGGRARRRSLPADRQRRLPPIRPDGLRMGARLPAPAERPLRRPRRAATERSNRPCGATTRGR